MSLYVRFEDANTTLVDGVFEIEDVEGVESNDEHERITLVDFADGDMTLMGVSLDLGVTLVDQTMPSVRMPLGEVPEDEDGVCVFRLARRVSRPSCEQLVTMVRGGE